MSETSPQAGQSRTEFVEVMLPVPLQATFTYHIPEMLRQDNPGGFAVGCRVVVPFGTKKFYTGIVCGTANFPPAGVEAKEIAVAPDTAPVIRHPQLKLWQWIADYYLCAAGDVMRAALPAGLKIESETFVELNPDYDLQTEPPRTDQEAELVGQLTHKGGALSVGALAAALKQKNITPLVNRLIERGVLIIAEKLVERYRPQRQQYVRLGVGPEGVAEAFAQVKGARKQEQLLLAMVELSGVNRGAPQEVLRKTLLERAAVSPAILQAVIQKGILTPVVREVNRFKFTGEASGKLPRLSDAQSAALDAIHKSWLTKDVTLLHGVTSSGKTEIYIHLINFVLGRREQVLFLVPEIALTTQLTRRLQEVFGSRVLIYHSKFSDNERVDIWKRVRHGGGEPTVVIGARSSVFLPFSRLGLVIVDEEHEQSYKQFDPAPRYNARDVAMVLARFHGAKTLLGSATPSVESYYKARNGKFGLVELKERFGNVKLPDITLVDTAAARKNRLMSGAFARETHAAAAEALQRGAQVILFQNRRGYAPLARCKQCAWVPRCEQCDVALTYHAHLRQLQCHYCGAVYPLPSVCPQCHEPAIEILGYGTERVEEEVEGMFGGKKMLRMDLDTTRNKASYEQIIDDFSAGKAQILVGTQMVTKGLDFGGVEMVGVLNADAIINYPDFRSAERAFNMLEQVAGRAGRREGQTGRVVVQTGRPDHPIFTYLLSHDYEGFFAHELEERRRFFYPPFTRIIYIYIKHRDPARLRHVADSYAARLRQLLGRRVFGPEEPAVGRVQGLYIRKIMLKIETDASVTKVKELLRQTYLDMHATPEMKGTVVYYDVDPC